MSLDLHRPATPSTADGWNRTISDLERALGSGDTDAVARVAVDVSLGRVPSHLEGRARNILEQITGLESQIEERRDHVADELHRITGRGRRSAPPAPPAPSQLDCSA
jgi:hypothetical protein